MVIEKGKILTEKWKRFTGKGGKLLKEIERNSQKKGDDYRELKLQKGNIGRVTGNIFRQKVRKWLQVEMVNGEGKWLQKMKRWLFGKGENVLKNGKNLCKKRLYGIMVAETTKWFYKEEN